MERYIIDTDTERSDWGIIKEGYNHESGKISSDLIFAKERLDRDDKILWLFDSWIFDEDIKKAEKKMSFRERAEFVIMIDGKEKERFEGTFIDALKYLKRFFTDYKKLNKK